MTFNQTVTITTNDGGGPAHETDGAAGKDDAEKTNSAALTRSGELFQRACRCAVFRPPSLSPREQAMLITQPWKKTWFMAMPPYDRTAVQKLIAKGLIVDGTTTTLSAAGALYLSLMKQAGITVGADVE